MPKAKSQLLTVPEILNNCQETTGAHGKYSRMLWEVEAANSNACYKELSRCLGHLLSVPMASFRTSSATRRKITNSGPKVGHFSLLDYLGLFKYSITLSRAAE